MTDEAAPGSIGPIASAYATHCARVADAIAGQADAVEALIDAMVSAGAIHCYGFGRSGDAAESFAIRLRHFQRFLPPVWWLGDRVRDPFERGQILVSFSRRGTGFELAEHVAHARERGLACAFVTRAEGPGGGARRLARPGEVVIGLPCLDPELIAPARLYGGGDFELAAYLFQEALVTCIGFRLGIPPSEVDRFHVH